MNVVIECFRTFSNDIFADHRIEHDFGTKNIRWERRIGRTLCLPTSGFWLDKRQFKPLFKFNEQNIYIGDAYTVHTCASVQIIIILVDGFEQIRASNHIYECVYGKIWLWHSTTVYNYHQLAQQHNLMAIAQPQRQQQNLDLWSKRDGRFNYEISYKLNISCNDFVFYSSIRSAYARKRTVFLIFTRNM